MKLVKSWGILYGYCATLRVTSAMEAGITDHVWSVEEIVKLAD